MRILVTGSPGQWQDAAGRWHANPGQLRAHVEPITALGEHQVYLVADAPTPPMPHVECVVPPRLLTRVVGRALAKALVCAAIAIRWRPDWVISFGLVPHGLTALAAAGLGGARVMVHLISGSIEWRGGGYEVRNRFRSRPRGPSGLLERVYLAALKRADAIVVMGTGSATDLRARGIIPAALHVVPASVDTSPGLSERSRRPSYDVVTVSRLVPHKRVDTVVRAVARLASTRPTIRVAIVGEGPERAHLEALTHDLRVAGNVSFCGFVPEVAPILRCASVFVLASEWEGLSVAACEAMATGIPVVVTGVGDMADAVDDGVTGLVVPVGDDEALASRIGELLDDPVLGERLGAAGRARVVEIADRRTAGLRYQRLLRAAGASTEIAGPGVMAGA